MKQEIFSGDELPEIVDVAALDRALSAAAPGAWPRYQERITWTNVDPETGEESFAVQPATLVVEGLPDDFPREDVLALVSGHAAEPPAPSLEERVAALEAKVAALEGK